MLFRDPDSTRPCRPHSIPLKSLEFLVINDQCPRWLIHTVILPQWILYIYGSALLTYSLLLFSPKMGQIQSKSFLDTHQNEGGGALTIQVVFSSR